VIGRFKSKSVDSLLGVQVQDMLFREILPSGESTGESKEIRLVVGPEGR
jgi:hypothetical protein